MKTIVNVTEQIRSILKEGQIELYFREEFIGRVSFSTEDESIADKGKI